MTGYAEERFTEHLPMGETGAVYRLYNKVEQLALSLQAKSETERRAREFLRDMISDISHQLKTPLAALTMYMEIMAQEADREETVRRFTEKSMRSLERMEQLILSLLKMARLDTGNIVFEKRQCYAQELVSQAVMELSERAAREGKTILREGSRRSRSAAIRPGRRKRWATWSKMRWITPVRAARYGSSGSGPLRLCGCL